MLSFEIGKEQRHLTVSKIDHKETYKIQAVEVLERQLFDEPNTSRWIPAEGYAPTTSDVDCFR